MTVYERLLQRQDRKYGEFQRKLVPNIAPELIIGVRTPALREIAKELIGTEEAALFINTLPHKYYEENLVHFFIIAAIKDYKECLAEIERFLPYVDCWPVSDQSSPKVFRKHHEDLLLHIREWIASEHVYTARFGMRILMNEYLDADFSEEYLGLVAEKQGDDYYLKMMQAWYFATALAKQYDSAVKYVEERKLDPWVHRKAIQKAVESFRVSDEHKNYLKSLRE